ncbi:MAG: hypothetical protein BroJett040_01400 [Oligoflexia bacterium]|nr:MAG: hypothetical protein BroJett040_01400 [Oligoflexia bacterium]
MKNKNPFLGCLILIIGQIFSFYCQAEETVSTTPSPSSAPTTSASSTNTPAYYMCKSNNAVRTLRVSFKGDRCWATYTKEGVDSIVGKSNTPDVCHDVVANIRKNLEAGNWKCKDISTTRISSSL